MGSLEAAGEIKMPQYQQQKKGMARIRVLGKDATRAYMLLMQKTGGKMQALPMACLLWKKRTWSILKTKMWTMK